MVTQQQKQAELAKEGIKKDDLPIRKKDSQSGAGVNEKRELNISQNQQIQDVQKDAQIELKSPTDDEWSQVAKNKALTRVEIGSNSFSNLSGDFLGVPYIEFETYRHTIFKLTLNNPGDSVRPKIANEKKIRVLAGFIDNSGKEFTQEVFTGEIYYCGYEMSNACKILAVDNAYGLQNQVGSNVSPTSSELAANGQAQGATTPDKFETLAKIYNQKDVKQGKATASGEKFDANKLTIAHSSLPFGSSVKIINPSTKKEVVATVNDRPPQGTDMLISPAVAKTLELREEQSQNQKLSVQVIKRGTVPEPKDGKTYDKKNVKPEQKGDDTNVKNLINEKKLATSPTSTGKTTTAAAANFAETIGKIFSSTTPSASQNKGEVRAGQSAMTKTQNDATKQGDVVVAEGNTIKQLSPGTGESINLTLDYGANPSAFSKLTIIKRTGLQLQQGGYGTLTVQGYSINDKSSVGATIVTPLQPPEHPTGIIQVPDWGKVKLKDPIFSGTIYTWADATKNGTRVPTKQIMGEIAKIAKVIQELTDKVGKGKWQINSWYRDPANNKRVGGVANSRHLYGDAVDFVFPGMFDLHKQLYTTWGGGLAINPGAFVHIDLGSKRRWDYGGKRRKK